MKRALMLAVTAILSTYLWSQPASSAIHCKANPISAWGSWKRTMAGARGSARRAWKARVRHLYGSCWDNWTRSRDKTVRCTSERRDERCMYQARPCCRAGSINSELKQSVPPGAPYSAGVILTSEPAAVPEKLR